MQSIRLFGNFNLKSTSIKCAQAFGKRCRFVRIIVSYSSGKRISFLCQHAYARMLSSLAVLLRVFPEMFHGIHREWLEHLGGRLSSIFLPQNRNLFRRLAVQCAASLNGGSIFQKYTRQNQYFPWTPQVGKHHTCERVCTCLRSRLKGGKDSFRNVSRIARLAEVSVAKIWIQWRSVSCSINFSRRTATSPSYVSTNIRDRIADRRTLHVPQLSRHFAAMVGAFRSLSSPWTSREFTMLEHPVEDTRRLSSCRRNRPTPASKGKVRRACNL